MHTNSSTNPHCFDRALALQPRATGQDGSLRFDGSTSADYDNMVGPFGGMTAAQALQAVLSHPERRGEPVAFSGNFVAALDDAPFVIEAQPVRTNRSTQHWTVTTRQRSAGGATQVVFTATVMTALRRETWGATDATMPPVPAPETVAEAAVAGYPEWFKRYQVRWIDGAVPTQWDGAESATSVTRLWARDRALRALDFPGLLALCDVGYPRIWLRRARMTPAGTVALNVCFHVDGAALARVHGAEYVLAETLAHGYYKGYFDQRGLLWRADGQLLASSHQVVYYKE